MKLLLAEDNHKLAALIAQALEEAGHVVEVYYDGVEAYDMASDGEYDVIILDRMMPGMEGAEVCRLLRTDGVQTPILFLTAKDAVSDRVAGLDAGADDYLIKPFAMDELLARVRTLLRRDGDKQPVLKYDSLTLDPSKRVVRRAGAAIDVTAKEYSLLEYLLRNAEHIVSQAQIIEHVWDQSYDGVSNVVQTYIKQLRRKIDKAFSREEPLITTVRGMGYTLRREQESSEKESA